MGNYQICTNCVMDTSDPAIYFNSDGVCKHCVNYSRNLGSETFFLSKEEKERQLPLLIDKIKRTAKNKKYDCVIGLSGGVDSSYVAILTHKFGLKPLAVHLDNGWNSPESVNNINNICKILNIDLYSKVIDWQEFRDLQLAFLKASTPDTEIITDHAIKAILYKVARQNGIKYIIAGTNYASESVCGKWSQGHYDWRYIKSVNKLFGNRKLNGFPHRSLIDIYIDKRIEYTSILDYVDYNKEEVKSLLKTEIGWVDYGRKHGESIFTRIFQEYILPTKFGYDKRKGHYSSLILANQMTREEAMEKLKEPLYESEEKLESDLNYLCDKLNITRGEFDEIMKLPKKSINDYPNRNDLLLYKCVKLIKKFIHR